MSMDLNQLTQQVPIRVASPQLVAANHILALSSAELQALIQREVMENPAIEMEEVAVCQQCGRPLQGTYCVNCTSSDKQQQEKSTIDRDDFADDGSMWQHRAAGGS